MLRALALAVLLAGCHAHATAGPRPSLVTTAEQSGWTRTGRYDEAARLCHDFARAYPKRARCDTFGTTPEQRDLLALIVSDDGVLTPAQAQAKRRPVILVQAGIHAGEIEGKDAGFELLRDLLDGKLVPDALRAVTVVFIPIFNVDGHERMTPNNRPNQRGPEEMGWRTTASSLNLNRDHLKVDAPEMAAQHALWNRWDPVVYVDLHTTDGAKFQHDVAVLVSPRAPRTYDDLDDAAKRLSDALIARVGELGHLPLPFYPSFVAYDDPTSGFEDGDPPPRFSQAYAAARNRIGILVETHSWRTYEERVRATYHVLQALLEEATRSGPAWRDAADAADVAGAELGGQAVTLLHAATSESRTIDFLGYHYEQVPSDVSGGTWLRYDEATPEVWQVPLRDQLAPVLTITAPKGGYLIDAGFADVVAARLDAHALAYERLDAAVTVDAEVWRATTATLGKSFEGRTGAQVEGAWTRESRELAAGSLWVPIAQARARLALELLEPQAPDSLTAWGFFNAVFEQKEYMEAYVAEEEARRMLEDPAIRAAFDEALKDEAFAKDPEARLQWFYVRHPSWDRHKDLLPVLRVDAPPR
jgi:hypothetical protein